jgi:cytochrome bd-type quinol oxidase subunit 2
MVREEREERGMSGKEGRAERWLVPVLIFVGTLAALTWIRVRRLGLWAILTGIACVILGYGIAWWRQERPRR